MGQVPSSWILTVLLLCGSGMPLSPGAFQFDPRKVIEATQTPSGPATASIVQLLSRPPHVLLASVAHQLAREANRMKVLRQDFSASRAVSPPRIPRVSSTGPLAQRAGGLYRTRASSRISMIAPGCVRPEARAPRMNSAPECRYGLGLASIR